MSMVTMFWDRTMCFFDKSNANQYQKFKWRCYLFSQTSAVTKVISRKNQMDFLVKISILLCSQHCVIGRKTIASPRITKENSPGGRDWELGAAKFQNDVYLCLILRTTKDHWSPVNLSENFQVHVKWCKMNPETTDLSFWTRIKHKLRFSWFAVKLFMQNHSLFCSVTLSCRLSWNLTNCSEQTAVSKIPTRLNTEH